jgi:hypothetical protein
MSAKRKPFFPNNCKKPSKKFKNLHTNKCENRYFSAYTTPGPNPIVLVLYERHNPTNPQYIHYFQKYGILFSLRLSTAC